MASNRFPAVCDYCGGKVDPGAGILSGRTHDDKPRIIHPECIPVMRSRQKETT